MFFPLYLLIQIGKNRLPDVLGNDFIIKKHYKVCQDEIGYYKYDAAGKIRHGWEKRRKQEGWYNMHCIKIQRYFSQIAAEGLVQKAAQRILIN